MPALDNLDLFHGDLTVARALVYARLPRPADDAGLALAGQVRGPRCLHAQTLPVSCPLVDLGPGTTLLARAVLPDPVFWSPDLPAIYDVTVNLVRGTEVIATARREIGLKSLGVRGRNFILEGKRWVLRGVTTDSTTAKLPREWHTASAALVASGVCEHPDGIEAPLAHQAHREAYASRSPGANELLDETSQWGALTVAFVPETGDAAQARLRQLACFPSVAFAVMRGEHPARWQPAALCPNILLAEAVAATGQFQPQPWAQSLFVPADDPQRIARLAAAVELPILAVRRLPAPLPIDQARSACDKLQRDLAPIGQFAGYIV